MIAERLFGREVSMELIGRMRRWGQLSRLSPFSGVPFISDHRYVTAPQSETIDKHLRLRFPGRYHWL